MRASRTTELDFGPTPPRPGTVHVYSLGLGADATSEDEFELLQALLSPDERERAERYRQPADRRRFVLTRATLRLLLGRCLGLPPHAVVFSYGPHGKPSTGACSLQFNVSHAADVGLIALAVDSQIGVDVELINTAMALDGLPQLVLTPRERAVFETLPRGRRHRFFFERWVCKEAVLKASGHGLAIPPSTVEVQPRRAAAHLLRAGNASERWWIQQFGLTRTHVAALALTVRPSSVRYRRLKPSSLA